MKTRFALHRADRYIRVKASRAADTPRPSLMERARSILAGKQIGALLVKTFGTLKDTPELNALKALFGAPISMGRGKKPVELLPAAACLPAFIYIYTSKEEIHLEKKNDKLYGPYASQGKEPFTIDSKVRVPIHLKMTLTIKEAAEYSNIGINKIDAMLKQPNCPFVLYVGTRKLVKRREFEEYIRREISI